MVGGLLYSSTLFSSYLYIYHTTVGASPAVQFSKKDPAKVASVYLLEKRFSNNAGNVQIVHRPHYNLKLVETHSHVLEHN